jgi:hypothetical protein
MSYCSYIEYMPEEKKASINIQHKEKSHIFDIDSVPLGNGDLLRLQA